MRTSASGNNRSGWNSAAYDRRLAETATLAGSAQRSDTLGKDEHLLDSTDSAIPPIYYYAGVQLYHPDHPFRCMQ